MFLIFINDLPDGIVSNIRLFADDCVVYRKISSHTDHITLQKDLDRITNWCSSWHMTLNTDICKLLTFSRKHTNSTFHYSLSNNFVNEASMYKYLGIHLTSDLTWSIHIEKVTSKASRTRGYQKRNLRDAPSATRKLVYLSFLRPQLEFASPIWSPHQAYLVHQLESIQSRAARFIVGDYRRTSSVTDMKSKLSLPLLETRRNIALTSLLHKIIWSHHTSTLPLIHAHRISRRLHNHRSLQRLFGRTKAFNSSALPRAINHWNNLPDNVVDLRDPDDFKRELHVMFS